MSNLFYRSISVAVGFIILLAAPAVRADDVVITYSPAGQITPQFGTICDNFAGNKCSYGLENFSTFTNSNGSANQIPSSGTFTSTFTDGASSLPAVGGFQGTYQAGTGTSYGSDGAWTMVAQNAYGGVDNKSPPPNGFAYPELYNCSSSIVSGNPCTGGAIASYTLNLKTTGSIPGVNYFGIWISALDAYNQLSIYDGATLLATFNSAVLQQALGTCPPGTANPYCGNPTTNQSGQDAGELFAYVNVFDLTGYISSVVFTNASGASTGFESSNHAVAYGDPLNVVGTPLPEPGSTAIFAAGAAAVAALRRRRRPAARTATAL